MGGGVLSPMEGSQVIKIKLEDRFTEKQLWQLFNVECDASTRRTNIHSVDEPYCFNDVKVPLWHVRNKHSKVSKRVKHRDDRVKQGVTVHPPGKQRVEDLVRFYSERSQFEESAFDI